MLIQTGKRISINLLLTYIGYSSIMRMMTQGQKNINPGYITKSRMLLNIKPV